VSVEQSSRVSANGEAAPSAEGALTETPPGKGNGIFRTLVTSDDDVVGFVAYSLYKQSKLDWVRELEREKGREPTDAELASFIVGESTPRRTATYRYLAETALQSWSDKRAGVAQKRSLAPTLVRYFNYSMVALALGLLALALTARVVFGPR